MNGIREFAHARGATITYVPLEPPDLRVNDAHLHRLLRQARPGQPNLFAYPAQSNVTGVQHPLDWIAHAQDLGWDVLVDCAAFVPTNRLDLSVWHPDFVSLSFYKMFGYPTGVGCFLARKSALAKLHRPWFDGGTITLSSVLAADATGKGFYLTPGEAGFEDGTINYLMLPAVEIGLRYLEMILHTDPLPLKRDEVFEITRFDPKDQPSEDEARYAFRFLTVQPTKKDPTLEDR